MANTRKNQLKKARGKGESSFGRLRGPNTGAWEKKWTGLRRPAQADGWARGYDGPGKGTW